MSYDPYGNCVLVTDRDGGHGSGVRRARPPGPPGHRIRRGRALDLRRRRPGRTATTEPDATTTFGYDGDERNPAVVVDLEGGQTRMTWQNGLMTRVVDPSGVVVTFAHDEHGDVVATSDADGNTARLERDAAGRVGRSDHPPRPPDHVRVHPRGAPRVQARPRRVHVAVRHTPAGRLSAIVDPTGARTDIEHGPHGDRPTRWTGSVGRPCRPTTTSATSRRSSFPTGTRGDTATTRCPASPRRSIPRVACGPGTTTWSATSSSPSIPPECGSPCPQTGPMAWHR